MNPVPPPPPPVDGPNYYGPTGTQPAPVARGKKLSVRTAALAFIVILLLIGGLFAFLVMRNLAPQLSTEQVHATATANAADKYPSYLPGRGNLAMADSLQYADNWNNTQNGHCIFVNNALHVRTITNNVLYTCLANPENRALKNATDSAFEVQMTITQGDCGGLAVRASLSDFPPHDKYYDISICQDGKYAVFKYNTSHQGYDIVKGYAYSAALNQGINQENTVDVVTMKNSLIIFLNKQQVANVPDTSLTQGNFGLIAAAANNHLTEVVFRQARIWTF